LPGDALTRDDARVVQRTLPHDRRIEQWYRDHHARLRGFCTRLLGDLATAEDVAQETLLRAWSNRDLFEPGADIRPWLFRVARNLCTDALRARARFVDVTPPDRADDDTDPVVPLERAETDQLVRRALEGLTERQRKILLLRDVEGVEYSELASRMGVNENTARAVLFRARRGLRKRFLEVARATAALALWPILRLRARRLPTVEQAAMITGHAGLSIVAAIALLVAPTGDDVLRAAAAEAAARATVAGLGAEAVDLGPADPDLSGRPWVSGASGVVRDLVPSASLSAARSGEARVHATTPNPATGGEAEVWADVWREADDNQSTLLQTYDEANETACTGMTATCALVDETLTTLEGP